MFTTPPPFQPRSQAKSPHQAEPVEVYPWCRLGSHDYAITRGEGTEYGFGLCRADIAGRAPCACPCHDLHDYGERGWDGHIKAQRNSLRSYATGLPDLPLEGHHVGMARDLVSRALPGRLRPAVVEERLFPVPERGWTWEALEDQVCLKDMRFRYAADYPRRRWMLPRQGDHSDAALAAHRAVWDLLRRVVLREESLGVLVAEWEPMRRWRIVAMPLALSFDSNVGFKWQQSLVVRKERR